MYTIIDSLLPQFPISINSACSCLNISRSQYYDWKIRNDSFNQSDPFEIQIKDKIHQIAIEFPTLILFSIGLLVLVVYVSRKRF
jgi:ACT domain-containing protein